MNSFKKKSLSVTAILLNLIFSPCLLAGEPVIESTRQDQKSIELTVYNQNMALIREIRTLNPPKGLSRVRVLDVPKTIIPESIQARSLNASRDFVVQEQSFDSNLVDSSRILDSYVGKKLKIQNWNQFQDRKETIEATLLSNSGEPVYQVGSEIYLGFSGTRILPSLPEGFLLKPAITWTVEAKASAKHEIELSYLAENLSWKADYILTYDESAQGSGLDAWYTLENHSGTSFSQASLRLIAGDVHRQANIIPQPKMMMARGMMSESMADNASFQTQPGFEYHSYDYAPRVSLGAAETRQLRYFQKSGIKVLKIYEVEGNNLPYFQFRSPDQNGKEPVRVILELQNKTSEGLGLPLPAGQVKIYDRSADGRILFAGEDSIAHTPREEKIRLQTGQAFDLVAERKQTAYRQVTQNLHESEWEITLKNQKAVPVTLTILESMPQNWKILSESQSHENVNAFKIKYTVNVPKQGEARLRYRLQAGY